METSQGLGVADWSRHCYTMMREFSLEQLSLGPLSNSVPCTMWCLDCLTPWRPSTSLTTTTGLMYPSFTGLVTAMDRSAWHLLLNSGYSEGKVVSTFLPGMSPNTNTRLPCCTMSGDLTRKLYLPPDMWHSFASISSYTEAEYYGASGMELYLRVNFWSNCQECDERAYLGNVGVGGSLS